MRSGATSVHPTYAPSIANPDAEVAFNSAIHTMVFQDDFSSYAADSDLWVAGWLSANETAGQDTAGSATGGANHLISPGSDGAGNAIQLIYNGNDTTGASQEARAWERLLSDSLLGTNAKECFVQFDCRLNPTAPFHYDFPVDGNQRIMGIKFLELWNSAGVAPNLSVGGRAQFSSANSFVCNNIPFSGASGSGTFWDFFGTASGVPAGSDPSGHPPQAGQCRPAASVLGGIGTDFGGGWAYQGVNKWHRLTFQYRTQTVAGARDGIARMWYDGTLIVAVGTAYAGVPVPGGAIDGFATTRLGSPQVQHWCELADLDDWFTNAPLTKIELGGVNGNAQWPFVLSYDKFKVWRYA